MAAAAPAAHGRRAAPPSTSHDELRAQIAAIAATRDGASAPPLTFPSAETPGKTWRLRKVRPLGKGSFGLASLVEDLDSPGPHRQRYVIKEISLAAMPDEKTRKGLAKEIDILRRVNHPNIVRYLDCHYDRSTVTILMEHCDGGDLQGLIHAANQRSPTKGVTEPEVWSVLVQLCMALKHLHFDHRILHRDLKPGNVFLTKEGIVKVGDFGVSTVLSQSVDFARTFCGSPYYLAPELVQEFPYNGKADLWSLGCVLYEVMARGERPFKGKGLAQLLQAIIHCRFVPIDDVVAEALSPHSQARMPPPPSAPFSGELRRVIPLLLRKDPDARASIPRLLRLLSPARVKTLLHPRLTTTPEYCRQFGWAQATPPRSVSPTRRGDSPGQPHGAGAPSSSPSTSPGATRTTLGITIASTATDAPLSADATATEPLPRSDTRPFADSVPDESPGVPASPLVATGASWDGGVESMIALGPDDADDEYADDFEEAADDDAETEARVYAQWAVNSAFGASGFDAGSGSSAAS